MKLCKDCKHYRPEGLAFRNMCARKGIQDLVTGLETLVSCFNERYPLHRDGENCGKEGRFWEPNE